MLETPRTTCSSDHDRFISTVMKYNHCCSSSSRIPLSIHHPRQLVMSTTPTFPRSLSWRSTSTPTSTHAQPQLHRPSPQQPAAIDPQALFRPTEKIIATQSCRIRSGVEPFVKAEVMLVVSGTTFGEQAALVLTSTSAHGWRISASASQRVLLTSLMLIRK